MIASGRVWPMTTTRTLIGLASVVAVAFVAGGCGSDDAAGVTDASAVEATSWTLEEISGEAIPDGVEVTLEYDGERISGNGGCNQYSGGATFDDGTVTIDAELMSTMMACEDPAAAVEGQYLEALPRAAGFVVEDGELRLTDGDDEPLLTFGTTE